MERAVKPLLALCMMAGAVAADPILSIDITTLPTEDYAAAVDLVRKAGAGATSLSIMWDEAETEPGVYAPAFDWPAIANAYYPSVDMALSLTLSLIDTVADRRPDDLKGTGWDDPVLATRFADYAARVLGPMPRVDLTAISVGNEVDVFLQRRSDIAAFAGFLAQAGDHLHLLRSGVPVGAKLTFAGLTADPGRWQPLLDASDALMVTYYPLMADFAVRPVADVARDLDAMLALAGDKPIYILEAGYPSAGCGAEPGGQAAFVAALMQGVRARPQIKLVSLTFLTDLGADEVARYVDYYGVKAECFARYLGSLGLRNSKGQAKPALEALLQP